MDSQLKDRPIGPDQQKSIDPLRRVFIPVEKRNLDGTYSFKTHDKQSYVRLEDGSIRRVSPKVNGKVARKSRAKRRA